MTMVDDAPRALHFDTDDLPERDRFAVFCEEIMRRYGAMDVVKRDDGVFRATIETRQAGVVTVGSRFSTPSEYIRTRRGLCDGNDSVVVIMCRSGKDLFTHPDLEQEFGPGDAILADLGYASSHHLIVPTQFSSIVVPRPVIAKCVPHRKRFAGLKLDRNDIARRLLFGYIGGTLRVPLETGSRAAELYGEHLVDLVALAIGAEGEAREIAEQRGARAARLAAIQRMISQQFGNPNLNAATIAVQLGVTPRYVHLLLEATGRSLTQHLLDRRLEQAAALLRDPRRQDWKITDIAWETGFTDLSHFNRAFRRRFGDTPSGVRGAAFRNPHQG
jgi:AraC-like DNA-binding protein